MQMQAKRPKGKCIICGKDILVSSIRGAKSQGYCSRVCASMKRYEKRFVGARSEQFSNPVNPEKVRKI
jgi:hypothetical protein